MYRKKNGGEDRAMHGRAEDRLVCVAKRASYVINGIAFEHSNLLRKPRLTRPIAKLSLQ